MSRLAVCFILLICAALSAQSQEAPHAPIQLPPDSTPTLLLRKVAPLYPPLARQARIQGAVVLSIVVNKDGEVRDMRLVSGHPMLSPAAINAVKQWRYKPYMSGDEPVEVQTIVRVNFELADGTGNRNPRTTQVDWPAGIGAQQLVRVSEEIMQGLLENKVDPEYPAAAIEKQIEGTVVLNVDVDNDGDVGRVELVSGDPVLAPVAMDAVLQWKYRTFVLNGETVPVETTVHLKFALAE